VQRAFGETEDRELEETVQQPYEFLAGMHTYLTESVYKVVWQKSIPARIRQLILYISNDKG